MAGDSWPPQSPLRMFFSGLAILLAGLFAVIGAIFETIADKFQKPPLSFEIEPATVELSNTKELVDSTIELTEKAQFPDENDFIRAYLKRVKTSFKEKGTPFLNDNILFSLLTPVMDIYEYEGLHKPPSKMLGLIETSMASARLNDRMISRQKKLIDPEKTISVITDTFDKAFLPIACALPPAILAKKTDSDAKSDAPTISILDFLPDIEKYVVGIRSAFTSPDVLELDLFKDMRELLAENEITTKTNKIKLDAPRDVIANYLKDTSLDRIFDMSIPFEIPDSRMMEHCVIVAGAGTGKTQTLGALIARYLQRDDPPALVVVDSTGALVKKIQTLALFSERLKDRIVIIDPEHTPIPALNMFDVSNPRLQGYSDAMKASIETEIIALFNYIFTSAQNDLTSRQGTVFSYVVRLVLSIPDSNIHTLLTVLEENTKTLATSKFKPYIDKLDSTAQEFFKNQYFELKGFRDQIAQRVYSLIQVPAFRDMFTTTNRIDFYDELQNKGSIILVNTSEMLLKGDASPLFGRYIIARTMASAFERAAIPEDKRRPTLLIVDECAPYVDDTFDKLLTRLRQFKLGIVAAFQHMEQVSEKLKSSIASNTSVKLAAGLGYGDSRWLARDMESTPEFLKAQRRDAADPPQWTELACYVRNFTPRAVSLTVPFYTLEKMRQMTAEQHRDLLERNRLRVSYQKQSDDASISGPAPEPSPATPRGDKRESTGVSDVEDDGSNFVL